MNLILYSPRRLNSTGDETHNDRESIDEHSMNNANSMLSHSMGVDYDLEEHYTFLAAREHLQQFSGQVPSNKKKKKAEPTEADSPAKSTKAKVIEIGFTLKRMNC